MLTATVPVPTDFQAAETAGLAFTIFLCVVCALGGGWLLFESVRRRDPLPAALFVGGAITCLQEPMLDLLGLVYWPENLPVHTFTVFDRPMPLIVPAGYALYVGPGSYAVYRLIRSGVTTRKLLGVALALEVSDVFFEMPWTALGVYTYFGPQPFEVLGFPLWWSPVNGTAPFLAGWLLSLAVPRLSGARRLLAGAIPPIAWATVYGAAAWPAFIALNADVPRPVVWFAALVTVAIASTMTWLIASAAGSYEEPLVPPPPPSEPPAREPVPVTTS